MASKKGIVITVIILGVITAVSFSTWLIPQNYESTFVISDFESHLDGVKNIHIVISEEIEIEFENLLDQNITPDEFIEIAEVTSSQINSQIIKLVESKASEEWYDSYLNYIESLKQYNSYIRESIVVANMIKNGEDPRDIENLIEELNSMKEKSRVLIDASDHTRPQ